jgi:uncharacterized protein (TIGR00375 family)
MPDLASAARFNLALSKIGNVTSDGRPILGLDAKELLRITLDASSDALFIPAHAWTPHFSVFGAASGFETLEECFEELSPHISAIETGLSSNPPMNWRVSALDRLTLISNSDAHSPVKMGREANVFETDVSYRAITEAIKSKKGFAGTIEFFPEEGKYHFDGHRVCGVCWSPRETIDHRYLCPVCGKRLTIGVAHRVEILSDRDKGVHPSTAVAYRSAIPLPEVLGAIRGVGAGSKKVYDEYMTLLTCLGSELSILLEIPVADIERTTTPALAEAIKRIRQGLVQITPGYDGEYGRIEIFAGEEQEKNRGQGRLL